MQCPRCEAYNPPRVERCVECGADLFTMPASPRPIEMLLRGLFYVSLGVVLLNVEPVLGHWLKPNPSAAHHRKDLFDGVVTWVMAIAVWAIGAQFVFQAWREMIAKRRLDAARAEAPATATTITMPPTSANTPRLHRALMVRLLVAAALVSTVRYRGVDPDLPPNLKATLAYACSACSAVLVAVASIVFKPRVPGRRSEQSISQYWSTPAVAANVSLVWLLVETSGMVALVGYFLTATRVSAVTMGLTIAALWLYTPSRFAERVAHTTGFSDVIT